ncbi:hypothetical protein [Streptomyces sp. NPDC048442]|uniref:hypothetical protein n=1 Tax=Streptomyces sp. NPDC048442 TaxID=3154823 RepID=UPI00341491F6
MPTTLPVPIEFRLPEGWRAVPPDDAGAPDVAFVALHPQPDDGFTANITIDGAYRPDEATLEEIADGSLERMREVAESVVASDRHEVGSPEAPGLTQKLTFSAVSGGAPRELVQFQVYLSMLDVRDPKQRAVVRLALTVTQNQFGAVLGDFQEFLRTVRPDTAAGTGPAPGTE